MMSGTGEDECELGLPAGGEAVDDGEWILAIFELGAARRATSVACRAAVAPDGSRLIFEPRDWQRLVEFAQKEATLAPHPAASEEDSDDEAITESEPETEEPMPNTARSPMALRPSRRP